ncbi:unnamed protein product (macronuclear) [Paramecium tetraurelia]|uniref:RING-type domain-containing protein n=1 Tax=Paramecium tetraurelia TaxID=5888 RepID=A0BWF0_PARTE|nr:uncharacterized protein GSPATT00032719001 [Paramecium tetraurelia]CAK62867.1 unnamed protein product [Paramecium tetraurelia]|eukprot:XP_001430265.1 hypothetical protein (macronuclear) [Paramecium tetraurelia strain d4-2]
MKQKKHKAYRESQEGKVSDLIKKLESNLKVNEKINSMILKLDKLKQQLTTQPQPQQNLKETIAQYEIAICNYEEERRIQNLTQEERQRILDNIRVVINSIEPLPAHNQNEKQIHKDLKNLNRIEEHFLILRTKSTDESFIVESSKIICQVVEKKNKIIMMIDKTEEDNQGVTNKLQQLKIQHDDSQAETPTMLPDEMQNFGLIKDEQSQRKSKQSLQFIGEIQQQSEKNLNQFETPTAGGDSELSDVKLTDNSIEGKQTAEQSTNENQFKQEYICEGEKCQICFAKKRRYVAIPCGHYIYCEVCKLLVEQKMKCLLCRQTVCQMFEVYA